MTKHSRRHSKDLASVQSQDSVVLRVLIVRIPDRCPRSGRNSDVDRHARVALMVLNYSHSCIRSPVPTSPYPKSGPYLRPAP